MNRQRQFSIYFSIFSVALFSLIFNAGASAQGRMTARYSNRDVGNIIKKVEQSSNSFRRDFDRAMDNSPINGTPAEDRFNNNVRDFENAMDRLRRDFDRQNFWWNSRSQVEQAVRQGQNVNTMMNTLPFRRNLERQWTSMRNDINTLADTYDLAGLNGGGWTGGGWNPGNPGNGGGWTSSPPNWARGTFYSRLANGTPIQMTISNNGQITANVGGQTYYGGFNRNMITLNGDVSTVSQINNGIRTVNQNGGDVTNYSKNSNGWNGGWNPGGGNGGGWNPGNGGGNATTPPNWARGTFYATLSNGQPITLTIANNGTVTANLSGSVYYGTYNNQTIVLNGDSSRVSRNGNGIRTINNNSGEATNYRRQ